VDAERYRGLSPSSPGAPLGLAPLDETNTGVAKNTLHVNKTHASRIIAPVVEGK
jgi:hypothetical protein